MCGASQIAASFAEGVAQEALDLIDHAWISEVLSDCCQARDLLLILLSGDILQSIIERCVGN
jgi:hypothetical protein